MKNLLTLALLATTLISKAQTLEHTYTSVAFFQPILLNAGAKYIEVDTGSTQVRIYNTDYTLWKTITAPAISSYKLYPYSYVVSDNLFNSDDNVEMVLYYSGTGSLAGQSKSVVINESGSILLDLGNCVGAYAYYMDGSFKLLTRSGNDYTAKLYALPGTLPCGHCGTSTGLPRPANSQVMGPVPNPSTGEVSIGYLLPAGVTSGTMTFTDVSGHIIRTMIVNGSEHSIQVNTSQFAPGSYIYTLTAEGAEPASNLLIVTH